jgi:hypothetical protein
VHRPPLLKGQSRRHDQGAARQLSQAGCRRRHAVSHNFPHVLTNTSEIGPGDRRLQFYKVHGTLLHTRPRCQTCHRQTSGRMRGRSFSCRCVLRAWPGMCVRAQARARRSGCSRPVAVCSQQARMARERLAARLLDDAPPCREPCHVEELAAAAGLSIRGHHGCYDVHACPMVAPAPQTRAFACEVHASAMQAPENAGHCIFSAHQPRARMPKASQRPEGPARPRSAARDHSTRAQKLPVRKYLPPTHSHVSAATLSWLSRAELVTR